MNAFTPLLTSLEELRKARDLAEWVESQAFGNAVVHHVNSQRTRVGLDT